MQGYGDAVDPKAMLLARCRASDTQLQHFLRGLAAVMNQWTALHIVAKNIDNNAFQSLYEELVEWHTEVGEVYSDEMEGYFEDFFELARSVVIQDDSMKEVADLLHDMYCRCCQDDNTLVERFVSTEEHYRRENPVALSVNGNAGDADDGNEEELGGLTLAEAEAAMANGEDGLYREGQDENNEEEGTPQQSQQQQQQQQKPKNNNRRKNASKKGNDGWSVVL